MHNEWMIQYGEHINDRDALVTRPSLEDPNHEKASPIVWKIYDGKFYPLEFSTDPLACSLLDGEVPPSFLDHFKELANRSPIGHLASLAVVSRELYNSASQHEDPVEYSNAENRTNTVVLCNRSELKDKTIETAWSFEKLTEPESEKKCIVNCDQMCRRSCLKNEDDTHAGSRHQPHHRPWHTGMAMPSR